MIPGKPAWWWVMPLCPLDPVVPFRPGVPEASWIQKLRIPFELVEGALKEVRSRTRKAP